MDRQLPDLLPEHERKHPAWLRVLYLFGALLLFLGGIVGWLIPAVTGIPFYIAGLVLLSMASERARHWINSLERRLPEPVRRAVRAGLHMLPGPWRGPR